MANYLLFFMLTSYFYCYSYYFYTIAYYNYKSLALFCCIYYSILYTVILLFDAPLLWLLPRLPPEFYILIYLTLTLLAWLVKLPLSSLLGWSGSSPVENVLLLDPWLMWRTSYCVFLALAILISSCLFIFCVLNSYFDLY